MNDFFIELQIETGDDLIELIDSLRPFSYNLEWDGTEGVCTVFFNTADEFELVMDTLNFDFK